MTYKILIVGAGQLGSRYLQGLARVTLPLDIFISDISSDSLATAEARWNDVAGTTNHRLRLGVGFSHVPQEIDVAIIATSADVRAQVVSSLSEHCAVRYWVLEKVLAQSLEEIDKIQAVIGNGCNAWVNTVRRSVPWHKEIKTKIKKSGSFSMSVEGENWGLACNAIHFFDMLAWFSDETLVSIDTQQLNDTWLEDQRLGFWETFGTLTAQFSGGSVAALTCHNVTRSGKFYIIRIFSGQDEWMIDESSGIAERSDGLVVRGKLSYQSEVTAELVKSILVTGACDLPLLKTSAELHRPLIDGLLEHFNRKTPNSVNCVPIT